MRKPAAPSLTGNKAHFGKFLRLIHSVYSVSENQATIMEVPPGAGSLLAPPVDVSTAGCQGGGVVKHLGSKPTIPFLLAAARTVAAAG